MVAATANWVASQCTTQLAVAATDHSAVSSDEMMPAGMRSDEVRWERERERERNLFAKCRQPEGLPPIKAGAYYR